MIKMILFQEKYQNLEQILLQGYSMWVLDSSIEAMTKTTVRESLEKSSDYLVTLFFIKNIYLFS